MNYFEFVEDIISNFRVSKLIDVVKIEQDEENNDLIVVAYENIKAVIIVAKYKQTPDIEMPHIHGYSQLDFVSQILKLSKDAEKVSVKYKEQDGIAQETTFSFDAATIKTRNVPKSLLPETPRNLENYSPDIQIELDKNEIAKLLKLLNMSIYNATVYAIRNKKGKLAFKLTNDLDEIVMDTAFEVEEGMLEEGFKFDLEKFVPILNRCSDTGCNFSISEKQNLIRIIKDNDTATYNYFMVKKV